MIARIWHGKTTAANFEAYTALLKKLAIPDYTKTEGFRGLTFLRNISNAEAHFTLITYWQNLEVIKNFAGEDFEKQNITRKTMTTCWSLKRKFSIMKFLPMNLFNNTITICINYNNLQV